MIASGTTSGASVATTSLVLTSAGVTLPVVEIVAAASSSPRSRAPESPMNSRAGKKLCGRKPMQQRSAPLR